MESRTIRILDAAVMCVDGDEWHPNGSIVDIHLKDDGLWYSDKQMRFDPEWERVGYFEYVVRPATPARHRQLVRRVRILDAAAAYVDSWFEAGDIVEVVLETHAVELDWQIVTKPTIAGDDNQGQPLYLWNDDHDDGAWEFVGEYDEPIPPPYDHDPLASKDHGEAEAYLAKWTISIVEESDARLPLDSAERKATPLFTFLNTYFPDAFVSLARLSFKANEKHNPGEPMHWAREKSTDHKDCILRHLLDEERIDPETDEPEAVAAAWRALANAQLVLEKLGRAQRR